MKPKIGQKLTYVDESCTEYTAKVTEIFTHQDGHKTVNIEYRHADRTTRKVNGLPFIDGAHDPESQQKVMCFSKKTPKKSTKKEAPPTEPIPDPGDIPPSTSGTIPGTSDITTATTGDPPETIVVPEDIPDPTDENPVVTSTETEPPSSA